MYLPPEWTNLCPYFNQTISSHKESSVVELYTISKNFLNISIFLSIAASGKEEKQEKEEE